MLLPLHIVVVAPPPNVWFSLQPEPGVFEQRQRSNGGDLAFDLRLRVDGPPTARGTPRLLGAHAKGPPDKRFVYVGVGKHAGDERSCWDRRIKVSLGEITHQVVAGLRTGTVLETRISGTGRDGGPACATVPLLPPGWRWRKAP